VGVAKWGILIFASGTAIGLGNFSGAIQALAANMGGLMERRGVTSVNTANIDIIGSAKCGGKIGNGIV